MKNRKEKFGLFGALALESRTSAVERTLAAFSLKSICELISYYQREKKREKTLLTL